MTFTVGCSEGRSGRHDHQPVPTGTTSPLPQAASNYPARPSARDSFQQTTRPRREPREHADDSDLLRWNFHSPLLTPARPPHRSPPIGAVPTHDQQLQNEQVPPGCASSPHLPHRSPIGRALRASPYRWGTRARDRLRAVRLIERDASARDVAATRGRTPPIARGTVSLDSTWSSKLYL